MARKKTKKQKQKTTTRRLKKKSLARAGGVSGSSEMTYSLGEIEVGKKSGKVNVPRKKKVVDNLFDYDPGLLVGDIRRTVLLSAIVFGIQVGLWWYLR